jgi:cobalt-precorrin-5B (C1)-methyltransferase
MKRLRSGYTTGACAAAAAKGAARAALTGIPSSHSEIPFPDGTRVVFFLSECRLDTANDFTARCSVIKDAGDDPDVTNGAEIVVSVHITRVHAQGNSGIAITGGQGVGVVTKPGLALPVGSPAINPVPLAMIREAVQEAFSESGQDIGSFEVQVNVSVPEGEKLARHTLNSRLGIIGGLSILGTTGIVVPVSSAAWTATITTSMDVARSMGVQEIVLSTGRTSERAVEMHCRQPVEAYVMMGDYLEFSLKEAARHGFKKIHLAGMWAKVIKAAMQIPQTHVRHGALEPEHAIAFLQEISEERDKLAYLYEANSAREIYERLCNHGAVETIRRVCLAARDYCQSASKLPVSLYLVQANGKVILTV